MIKALTTQPLESFHFYTNTFSFKLYSLSLHAPLRAGKTISSWPTIIMGYGQRRIHQTCPSNRGTGRTHTSAASLWLICPWEDTASEFEHSWRTLLTLNAECEAKFSSLNVCLQVHSSTTWPRWVCPVRLVCTLVSVAACLVPRGLAGTSSTQTRTCPDQEAAERA